MPTPTSKAETVAGLTGAALAVLVVGLSGGERIEGLESPPPGLRLVGDTISVPAGAWLSPGPGGSIAVTLEPAASSFDLVLGSPIQPMYSAGITSDRLGIYDAEGLLIGRGGGGSYEPGQRIRFEFGCQPPLKLQLDDRVVDIAEAPGGCQTLPLSLHAGTALLIDRLEVDDAPVEITARRFDGERAASAGVALATLALSLGPASLVPLLLAPLSLLLPKLGAPVLAGVLLLVGAAGVHAASRGVRVRTGSAVALFGLIAAAGAVVAANAPNGLTAGDSELVARALSRQVGIEGFLHKVQVSVDAMGPRLASRPKDKPLLLALGSSSTGGSGSGTFWPDVVAQRLPRMHVENLAVGGATTWHVRQIVDKLAVHADICVLYAGHNDTLPTLPGITLAALERGEPPQGSRFLAPVPIADARENIQAISRWCTHTLVMQELSVGREATMAEYAAMLQSLEGARWADGAARLAAAPRSVVMLDPVHPTARGHEILGDFVVEHIQDWLNE